MFVGLTCTAITDIVEYGFISADLVTATASYVTVAEHLRADGAGHNCVRELRRRSRRLSWTRMLTLGLTCLPVTGDRATGLAAAFSGSP